MTEAEWLSADHPKNMLDVVRRTSDRKLRLFVVAACRRLWSNWADDLRRGVETAERYADGLANDEELANAYAISSQQRSLAGITATGATRASIRSGVMTFVDTAGQTAASPTPGQYDPERWRSEWQAHCGLLREIFGNPFRPVAFDPAWRSDTAVSLARRMYETRDFSAMPILADALQDSGCENADVLDHCRGPGPHVRGCWVEDAVLGLA